MSHMNVSVFLVCVVKLMLCPTIKYWLAMPLVLSTFTLQKLEQEGAKSLEHWFKKVAAYTINIIMLYTDA